ncbi:MAG: hypothetical protein ACI90V_000918 [Bacillariaceae sp.]|jgi:hypothetical protein
MDSHEIRRATAKKSYIGAPRIDVERGEQNVGGNFK